MLSYRQTILDNGLRLVTAHSPYWRSLSLGVFANAGSRHDPAARQGLAHFTEHMLFKGTARRSAKKIAREAESVGGSLNAYTSEEHTCYHVRSPANQLSRMVPLLADMYQNSTFPEDEVQRERQIVEDEILLYRDEPCSHVDDLLSAAVWPRHALGRPILGTLRTVGRIRRSDFFQHLSRSYGARNSVVAVASPQSHEEMAEAIEQSFGGLAPGRKRRTRSLTRTPSRQRDPEWLTLEDRPIEQVHLRIAFPTLARDHPQSYPSRLLSVILGETMGSRLAQELREKRGYCYSLGSSRELFQDVGLFTIHASFEPRFLCQVIRRIGRQLRRLKENPPGARELREAYHYVAGHHDMGLEETTTQMFWLGDAALHGDHELDPHGYLSKLSRVRPERVETTARQIFRAPKMRVALLGPDLESHRHQISEWCRQAY